MSAILPDLQTPRLTLRGLQTEDVMPLCSYRSLPEVARFQSWSSFSPEDAKRLIASQANLKPGVPGTWFQFAILERETGRMIGDCGLHCLQENARLMEVGITLAPAAQKQGFATEALICLLDFVFGTLQAHRVSGVTDVENAAAASLFLHLGFRKEAQFTEHRWYKGHWDSEFVFAMLQREWKARSPGGLDLRG
ncbi:MAG TPA: GNAT family protein [Candidatus Saccharimonadales bacterium]|nr:GNAT family protein [Candidatus Saccharimonadales bacterium]